MTFDVGVSDMYKVAWWTVHVTSKPENIHRAVDASLKVLRDIATMRIMPYELERAKVTVLTKHDADIKVRCLPAHEDPFHAAPASYVTWIGRARGEQCMLLCTAEL